MNHAAQVLADLEAVTGGPLPTVLHIEGDYVRPTEPARLPPPKALKHEVWLRNVVGIFDRFEIYATPATAKDEALIEARGRYPGMSFNVSVRVAL